jgi:signal transduction histidine kinase
VPERARQHLFEAFQSVARKGGTGLGLAIAAELVNAHGGEIALLDNEGGATFRILIPDVVVELDRARRRRA